MTYPAQLRIIALAAVLAACSLAVAQSLEEDGGDRTAISTAFTYQGRLTNAGVPVNGPTNFLFSFWNASSGGGQTGPTLTVNGVSVVDGLFSVALDFGMAPFATSEQRWLQISVQGVPLAGRQLLAATPFSLATRGLAVDANGNLGVGTTTPARRLEVYDPNDVQARVASLTGDPAVTMTTLGQLDWCLGVDRSDSSRMKLGTGLVVGANPLLTVDSSGSVGIGAAPVTERLYVNGDIRVASNSSIFGVDRVVGYNDLHLSGDDSPAGVADLSISSEGRVSHRAGYSNVNFNVRNAGDYFAFSVEKADGTTLLDVLDDGRIVAYQLPYIGDHRNMQYDDASGIIGYDNSSARYKENIQPLVDDFTQILKAEPKIYTRREADPNRWEIGYIAEEIDALGLSHLVEYDRDGRPDGVNYEKATLYLNEVVKQQQKQIATQKTEIDDLRARLERVEAALRR